MTFEAGHKRMPQMIHLKRYIRVSLWHCETAPIAICLGYKTVCSTRKLQFS